MKVLYPACFYAEDDGMYSVIIPDLGCATQGNDLVDAFYMAQDCISGWILSAIEDGEKIPKASDIKDIKADEYENGFVNLVFADIDLYAESYGEQPVRRSFDIPQWLDQIAKDECIDLQELLKQALRKKIDEQYE